ncbi:MAG: ATP-grasp domain-containing protein [Bacillaceae bacterium]|nr:ATP-grasp domain-containing protein [Bacillaceae bacterium]
MIILDKPYVSPLLEQTIVEHDIPVLINDQTLSLTQRDRMKILDENLFFQIYQESDAPLLYTNSENAIRPIFEHLRGSQLESTTRLLKNKALFREKTATLYPELTYLETDRNALKDLKPADLPFPFVIKPSVGFFSMGVYRVDDEQEWQEVIDKIEDELERVRDLYPSYVLGTEKFLIEDCIEGDEFAVDAYYDRNGRPVILNILKHLFASSKDTSDRVYFTGAKVIQEWLEPFERELDKIGRTFNLKGYPVHIEFRAQKNGRIYPIELNPLRFAGWCSTDIAYEAFGINPYEFYLFGKKPDWPNVLRGKEHNLYSVTVCEISHTVDRNRIRTVDFDRFLSLYRHLLELRKIDYRQYPVFAFVFSETDQMTDLKKILTEDLTQYLVLDNN